MPNSGVVKFLQRHASRPQGYLHTLALIAVLTGVYFGVALWGLKMSYANTNATPIWPASGVAFTAILLFGYRVWPGIWLGAFAVNVVVFVSNHFVDFPTACFISFFIACGNTAESVLGVFLLEGLIGSRNPLSRMANIFKFVMIVPVAAMCSATVGVLAVGLVKQLPSHVIKIMGLTWWIGDILSILLLVPVFLILKHSTFKPTFLS